MISACDHMWPLFKLYSYGFSHALCLAANFTFDPDSCPAAGMRDGNVKAKDFQAVWLAKQ